MGQHRLMCGSATDPDDVVRLLDGTKPNLMVTDPPYGVAYDPSWRTKATGQKITASGTVLNDDRSDWREAWELFPGEIAYVWHGGLHTATVQHSLESSGFRMRAQIIWVKDRLILSRGHYHWKHEPCWYAVRAGAKANWKGGRKQTTTWDIPVTSDDGSTGHGTQKPVECMARPIRSNSEVGETIYEPFSGSGSTVIAGEMTGRSVLAMELSPAYVDLAVRRWQRFTGKSAIRMSDNKSSNLAELEKEDPDAAAWA